jgi:hypothetical protein
MAASYIVIDQAKPFGSYFLNYDISNSSKFGKLHIKLDTSGEYYLELDCKLDVGWAEERSPTLKN